LAKLNIQNTMIMEKDTKRLASRQLRERRERERKKLAEDREKTKRELLQSVD